VLAENFWLLVLVPLVIGAITFGVVSFLPKTYESVAILAPQTTFDEFGNQRGETAASMVSRLESNEVKTTAAGSQGWIRDQQLDPGEMRSLLDGSINVRSDRQSGLVTLKTFAPSPDDAQSLAKSTIEAYIAAASPRGAAQGSILDSIAVAENALAVLNPAISILLQVDEKTGEITSDLASQPATRPALADLVAQRTANERQIVSLKNSLAMTMQDIVIQAPTFNEKPVKPKRLQLTAIAVILSGLALTVFVFIRAALRGASSNPEGADKIGRIRRGILRR